MRAASTFTPLSGFAYQCVLGLKAHGQINSAVVSVLCRYAPQSTLRTHDTYLFSFFVSHYYYFNTLRICQLIPQRHKIKIEKIHQLLK